jgi:hypothetical protein
MSLRERLAPVIIRRVAEGTGLAARHRFEPGFTLRRLIIQLSAPPRRVTPPKRNNQRLFDAAECEFVTVRCDNGLINRYRLGAVPLPGPLSRRSCLDLLDSYGFGHAENRIVIP